MAYQNFGNYNLSYKGAALDLSVSLSVSGTIVINSSGQIVSTAYNFAANGTVVAGTDTTMPVNSAGVAAAIAAAPGGGISQTAQISRFNRSNLTRGKTVALTNR